MDQVYTSCEIFQMLFYLTAVRWKYFHWDFFLNIVIVFGFALAIQNRRKHYFASEILDENIDMDGVCESPFNFYLNKI